MTKPIFCATLILGLCCLAASRANAQQTYIYSQIAYDDTTNTVQGYSATEVDYYCADDYSAYVEGYLYNDASGLLLDSGSNTDSYIAEVYTSASADPSTDYTVVSYHDVIARYYYQDIQKSPEGCMPCDGCNTDCYYYYENWWWYDPFGFSFTNPGYYGPWWDVYGFGPPHEVENDEYDYLGSTSDSLSTRGNPDHLQIVSDVTRTLSCDILERNVTYRIVDVNNHSTGRESVRENDSTLIDSCTNQTVGYNNTCTLPQNPFTDSLVAGCPNFGDYDCGYEDPNEQWLWCTSGLPPLATLDYNVRHDRIVISGYSGPLPRNWYVRADRSISRR